MRPAAARTLAALALAAAAPAFAAECTNMATLVVPGADRQAPYCLEDLSTRNLILMGRTDASDWGTLHSQQTRNPSGAVPGIQIDGHFPDTSTFNPTNGWFHDSQFV
ncbi:MAG: tannase/feruloyl esterase family alpha/beta hydrolase, partial [Pseudomonadota bacterium]|nr:tannase/feruloyl esterase family alpha/beta hydrolase [Pseudomonadota bacterium]